MSLLADKIVQATLKPGFDKYDTMPDTLKRAAADIVKAQCFVISDDVRDACRNLVLSRPTTLVEALRYARPPFEWTWFEWDPGKSEKELNRAQVTPLRTGALIHRIAPNAWTMWTGWSYDVIQSAIKADAQFGRKIAEAVMRHDPGVGVSAMMLGIDLTAPIAAPSSIITKPDWMPIMGIAGLTEEQLSKLRDDGYNPIHYVLGNPREREALEALDRRMGYQVRDEALLKAAWVYGRDGMDSAITDVQEEIAPMLATLVLMNSKNCVEVEAVTPPPKLNRARVKRGKLALRSHSVVHINLSRTQRNAADARGLSREEARRHKVRGHFKIRRSGVFWWNEFKRGDPRKGKVEHDYEVEP